MNSLIHGFAVVIRAVGLVLRFPFYVLAAVISNPIAVAFGIIVDVVCFGGVLVVWALLSGALPIVAASAFIAAAFRDDPNVFHHALANHLEYYCEAWQWLLRSMLQWHHLQSLNARFLHWLLTAEWV